jgi:hypothetical protein
LNLRHAAVQLRPKDGNKPLPNTLCPGLYGLGQLGELAKLLDAVEKILIAERKMTTTPE